MPAAVSSVIGTAREYFPGTILRQAVVYCCYDAIHYSQRLCTVGIVAFVLERIAPKGLTVLIDTYPINCEPLRNRCMAVDRNPRTTMAGSIRRTVGGEPAITFQRRTDDYRLSRNREFGRVECQNFRVLTECDPQTMPEPCGHVMLPVKRDPNVKDDRALRARKQISGAAAAPSAATGR